MSTDFLRATLEHELLRYACGRAIFCPSCNRVLDADRSVLLVPASDDTRAQARQLAASPAGHAAVTCAECYDLMRGRLSAVEEAALLRSVEITDGREVARG